MIAVLVAAIGLGVVLAALRNGQTSLAPLLGDLSPTSRPADTEPTEPIAVPSPVPRVGILGSPLPERPVPLIAGWLRWLDPRNGALVGDAQPMDPASPDLASPDLAFADASGDVVQLCGSTMQIAGRLIVSLDVCAYDGDGRQRTRFPVLDLRPESLPITNDLPVSAPFALDATISRDGQWLWIATSVHVSGGWEVTVHRVDIAERATAGSRTLRMIPDATAAPGFPSAGGWLVADTSTVRPVVRASPDGARLSVTMTELRAPGAPVGLLQQERVEFDASLEPSTPIDVAFPVGAASDVACDPSRAGWATDQHYLSLCWHAEPNGDIQPFVRIENPFDMTRDVAIGPLIPAADQTTDDSSWLLDVRRGVLHRWSYLHHTLTTFEVETRAGTTLTFDFGGPPPTTGDWPVPLPGSGSLAWSSLDGGTVPGWSALRLAGSADGTVLYALGLVPRAGDGLIRLGSTVWVIDARTGRQVGRWDTPGPVDQLALAPGGGPLVELVTPRVPQSRPQLGVPVVDWTTQVWFVDQRTGVPLEVLGEVRGPGYAVPVLLNPSVAGLAGF